MSENLERNLSLVDGLEDSNESIIPEDAKEILTPEADQEAEEKVSNEQEGLLTKGPILNPLAPPWQLVDWFKYEDLKERFDAYWKKHEANLIEKYKIKGKMGKGGRMANAQRIAEKSIPVGHLYGDCVYDLLNERLSDEVLFIEGMQFFDYRPGKVVEFVGVVYFVPKLETDISSINWACKQPPLPSEEKQYQIRLKELQRQYRSLEDDPGGVITVDSNVLIDLTARIEGKPYVGGSVQGQWVEVAGIPISELRDHLIGHSVNDLFECEYPANKHDSEYGGKSVQATIKIHNLQQITMPKVDDDLAKDAGFDDLVIFKKRFKKDYQKYVDQALKSTVTDHMVTQVIQNSKLPPLPQQWVDLNIKRMADQYIKRCDGNKKAAMASIGIKSEEAFKECFKGQFYSDFMRKLALGKYEELYEVKIDTDEFYQDMIERVRWVNADDKETT